MFLSPGVLPARQSQHPWGSRPPPGSRSVWPEHHGHGKGRPAGSQFTLGCVSVSLPGSRQLDTAAEQRHF